MQAFRILRAVFPVRQLVCAITLGSGLVLSAAAQTAASGPASTTPSASSEALEIQRLIREGQHAQALKVIDDSLAKNPKDPQMRFRRGVALSMLDRKAEALAVFQKLVDDNPDMPAPYNNMAVIYGAQGEYDKARGALERAIRTNPAYATAYQNLGDVYAQLASQAYSKALQLDKNDASVPPKLALLRELTSGPSGSPSSATVAATTPQRTTPPAVTSPTKPTSTGPTVAITTPPAASKPTAPPPVVATTSSGAATKPAPTASINQIGEVESAVKGWASAWSRRDINSYFAAYSPEFAGQAGSRKTWEQERRDRIVPRKQISVEISDLRVSVNGDQATARFRQGYTSDNLSVTSRKTLQLQRNASGKWLIRQESAGN